MNPSQIKRLKEFQDDFQKPILGGLAILVITLGGYQLMKYRTLLNAEKALAKGFGAVAADTLESYRHDLTSSERGCRTLVNAYFQARKPDLLEWSAQSCINSGIESVETLIGYAAAFEMTGRDQEALRILGAGAQRFQKAPDFFFKIAQLFQRNKREADAVKAFVKAASIDPDNLNVGFEVIANLSNLQAWNDAKPLADRFKTAKIDNPAGKLLLARIFLKANDTASLKDMVNQARELMNKNPEAKAELEKIYADVLTAPAVVGK